MYKFIPPRHGRLNHRLAIDFRHDVRIDRVDPMLEGASYRIVQEGNGRVSLVERLASKALRVKAQQLSCIEGDGTDATDMWTERKCTRRGAGRAWAENPANQCVFANRRP